MELEDQEREIQLENEPIIYAGGGAVNSVNGYTGDVVLTTSDLQNTSDYQTGTEVDTAIQEALANLPQDFITLTDDDANYQNPETEEDAIALWLLDGGKYLLDKDATVGIVPRLVQYDGDWVPENLEFTEENPIMLVDKEGAFVYITVVSSTGNFKAIVESANGHTSSFAKFAQVAFMGATSSANGEEGLVPAPTTSDINKFLKGDGTWGTVAVPNVVQTTGSSITDVMSQNAVTQALSSLSVIKILTDDDANWTNPDTGDEYIASWLLEKGIYALAEDATISIASYVENEGGETTVANEYSSSENPVLWTSGYNSGDPTSYADITTITNVSSCYYTVNGNGEIDELSWFIPSVFIGTNGNDDGFAGLVPAPATTDAGKFLKADGTWDDAGGGVTELTSADYDYPTDNPTSVALWKKPAGMYYWDSGVSVRPNTSETFTNGMSAVVFESAGTSLYFVDIIIFYGGGAKNTIQWYKTRYSDGVVVNIGNYPYANILNTANVQSASGASTADVMSQNATTSMVFADPNTQRSVRIGNNKDTKEYSVNIGYSGGSGSGSGYVSGTYSVGVGFKASIDTGSNYSVAIGSNSQIGMYLDGAVALGAYSGSNITAAGMMDIGSTNTSYGYNSSNYRLLTGLYDGQAEHDAATKGQLDANVGIAKTLTTSDYNYDKGNTGSNNCVALWLLPAGLYTNPNNVGTLLAASYSISTANRTYLISKSDSALNDNVQIIMFKGGALADRALYTMNSSGGGFSPHYFLTNIDTKNSLTSTDTVAPLSANQGKVLNDKFGGMQLVKITQTDYDNLQTYDADTLYIITGA